MEALDQQEARELLADFVDEAVDSLRLLAEQLQAFQLEPGNSEPIHGVFRAVHSIKGCAGFLGLTAIKSFSHTLENQLDEIRNGQVVLSDNLRQRFVQSFDMLEAPSARLRVLPAWPNSEGDAWPWCSRFPML